MPQNSCGYIDEGIKIIFKISNCFSQGPASWPDAFPGHKIVHQTTSTGWKTLPKITGLLIHASANSVGYRVPSRDGLIVSQQILGTVESLVQAGTETSQRDIGFSKKLDWKPQ
jgi:hypothetical protein